MFFGVDVLAAVLDFIPKILGAVLGVFAGWMWGQWQAGSAWKKREFNNSILLSLNIIEPFTEPREDKAVASLKLRTLFERDLRHVMRNTAMQSEVRAAMERAKAEGPVLSFPEEDSWYILNTILNQIAEQFAAGTMRDDMGGEVQKRWYVFCLTYEHSELMHQFKPRILLIDKERFWAFPKEGEVLLESYKHEVRVDTIRLMQEKYEKHPHLFMELELAL